MLLPGIPLKKCITVAERLRAACPARPLTARGVRQSVSIGVTSFPSISDEDSLVADAGAALGQAKPAGRNRTICRG